jgi:hypothetical protein
MTEAEECPSIPCYLPEVHLPAGTEVKVLIMGHRPTEMLLALTRAKMREVDHLHVDSPVTDMRDFLQTMKWRDIELLLNKHLDNEDSPFLGTLGVAYDQYYLEWPWRPSGCVEALPTSTHWMRRVSKRMFLIASAASLKDAHQHQYFDVYVFLKPEVYLSDRDDIKSPSVDEWADVQAWWRMSKCGAHVSCAAFKDALAALQDEQALVVDMRQMEACGTCLFIFDAYEHVDQRKRWSSLRSCFVRWVSLSCQ